jgi:hypothetical protein
MTGRHNHSELHDWATSADNKIATSQIALTESSCQEVYATDGYSSSASNLSKTSLDDDNVFGDDSASLQLAEMSGSVDEGFIASLTIGIDA